MSEQPSEDGTVGIEDVSTTQEQPLEDGIGGSELGIEDVITTKEQTACRWNREPISSIL